MTSAAFAEHVRGVLEAALHMKQVLEDEKKRMRQQWSQRDSDIAAVVTDLAGIWGDLIELGASPHDVKAFESPEIAALSLPSPT
jgi:hypothetical protein